MGSSFLHRFFPGTLFLLFPKASVIMRTAYPLQEIIHSMAMGT